MMNRREILLSAIILALIGQTAFSADLDNNGIEDSYEQALAEKFCPSLQLHSGDQGVSPEPVEIMGTDNWHQNLWGKVWNSLGQKEGEFQSIKIFWCSNGQSVNLENYSYIDQAVEEYRWINNSVNYNWACSGLFSIAWHFDWAGPSINDPAGWYNAYADEAANNYYRDTIYVHLFKWEDKYVIQYWFFYPFNDYINNHEGDWEHINVLVTDQNPENAQIETVVYYFHHFYRPISPYWYVVDGTHPVVFAGGYGEADIPFEGLQIGNGSHGSYPYPGHWVNTGEEIPMVGSPDEYVDGAGRYIDHNEFDVKLIKEPDYYNYETNPEMSWLKALVAWGHIEVDSPGDWAEQFPSLVEVGNNAPPGPAYNGGWNVAQGGQGYSLYNEDLPTPLAWEPPTYPTLQNPSFEEVTGTQPDYWPHSGPGSFDWQPAAKEGASSAHISRGSGDQDSYFFQKYIQVTPGTTYYLRAWVRVENHSGGSAGVGLGVWENGHWSSVGSVSSDTDWIPLSGTWTAGASEDQMEVRLYTSSDFVGDVYYDGLYFSTTPPAAHYITADTTWSGTVEVTGDITVESGATLTISPGTVVRFAANSDDQGTGCYPDKCELVIRGALVANNATFCSDASQPTNSDWEGITVRPGGSATLTDCTLNHAVWGVYVEDAAALTVNQSEIAYSGTGVVNIYNNNGIIADNTIHHNNYGICGSHSSLQQISGNTVKENDFDGISLKFDSYAEIFDNLITQNAFFGIGLEGTDSSTVVRNNIIAYNLTGIDCGSTSPEIRNNTIANHTNDGIYCVNYSEPHILNNIIISNGGYAVKAVNSSHPIITYNDVFDNNNGGDQYGAFEGSTCTEGEGNIHQDPLFVNSTGGDYHLQDSSACIDAGDPSMTDPNGSRIDMGNYGGTWEAKDATPPVITNVQASNIAATSATIAWSTNENSDSKVDYGTTISYGSTRSDASRVTNHSVGLTGLSGHTTYHYRVRSEDAAGNEAACGDYTSTTTHSGVEGNS